MILRIWSQDPPYDIPGEFWNVQIKKAILPELGVGFMPKPFQKPHPPIHISIASPHLVERAHRSAQRLGHHLGPSRRAMRWRQHWAGLQQSMRAKPASAASGDDWRVARNLIVAPTDAEADERVFGERASNHYLLTTCARCSRRRPILAIIKPRPDMSDEEVHARGASSRMRHPRLAATVLDKLVALREEVGPFGTLLRPASTGAARTKRGSARHAAPGPGGDAAISPARSGAGGRVNNREAGTGSSMVTWCAVLQRSDATMPGPSRN